MWKPLSELKNKHKGSDIYIVGSGYSVDFFNKSFFDDKIVIGINFMPLFIKSTYCFFKGFDSLEQLNLIFKMLSESTGNPILIAPSIGHSGPEYHIGSECITKYDVKEEYYICDVAPVSSPVDTSFIGSDVMCQTFIAVGTAMCIAYYLGAKNIILVGVDCGVLDDTSNIHGYYNNKISIEWDPTWDYTSNHLKVSYSNWGQEQDLRYLRNRLNELGCPVCSLNPFINIGLEGHLYKKVSRSDTTQVVNNSPSISNINIEAEQKVEIKPIIKLRPTKYLKYNKIGLLK